MKPTLHILSLPHTQLTEEYVSCAYTQKARKLAIMMENLGYKVVVYGSEDFDPAIKGEKVTCITKKQQQEIFGDNDHTKHMYNISWDVEGDHWRFFNAMIVTELRTRLQPQDLILTFAGVCQESIAKAYPDTMTVEAGIGYEGTFARFKVYESAAWQAYCHGRAQNDNIDFYEVVIPNYWDESEFPFFETRTLPQSLSNGSKDYFLYVGRLISRKGFRIAQDVCERTGKRLILAGQLNKDEQFTGYGEYIGTVGVKERGELMANALGVFTPTLYFGPFEGVHAEAQLCGTPVITTAFGVYNDTVQDFFNGQRCYTLKDFINAVKWCEGLDSKQRKWIRDEAQMKWSMNLVAAEYDRYFRRLMDLYKDGWYQL